MGKTVFETLQNITKKPGIQSIYEECPFKADTFWNDPYLSEQLLKLHLHPHIDLCSRRHDAIAKEVNWINDRFNIGSDTRICDFGCGPGLYTNQWVKTGAQVTGIDISENSLAYARKQAKQQGLAPNYVHQNFLDYSSPQKFDLVTMIFNVYNDLDDKQRARLLNKFHDLLDDDGAIVLDVSSLNKFADKIEKQASFASSSFPGDMPNFWAPGYHYLFTHCFKYDDEHITLDKYTVVDEQQIREEFIWIKYYDPQSLTAEFEASGFKIIEHYADFSGAEYQPDSKGIAIIAKKI
jgi:SAM-dependent methyltransferase